LPVKILNALTGFAVFCAAKTGIMQRAVFITLLFCAFWGQISGQSTAYVFKGGLSLGSQKWDNSERQLLFAWHAALSIESVDDENDQASLFAQLGYHVRGSATRFRFNNFNGFPGGSFSEGFRFNNISLVLGAKQKFPMGADGQNRLYYFGGIRGDYTLSTIGGVSAGGGFEFKLGELVGGELQLAVHPDFTLQYRQPPGEINLPGKCTIDGKPLRISLPERKIRNTTVELSLGIRLLKKVVYEE